MVETVPVSANRADDQPLVGRGSNKELLSALLGVPKLGIAIFDRQLRLIACNQVFGSMGQVPARKLPDQSPHEPIVNLADELAAVLGEVIATGKPSLQEVRCRLRSQKNIGRWIASCFPIRDRYGKIGRVRVLLVEASDLEQNLELPQQTGTPDAAAGYPAWKRSAFADGISRSWKEIAHYTGTSVRTVQRWEEQLGLPVRRTQATKGAVVFAFNADLDRWLRQAMINAQATAGDFGVSTEFLKSAFPTLILDANTCIVGANLPAASCVGMKKREVVGKKLGTVLGGINTRDFHNKWKESLRKGAAAGFAVVDRGSRGSLPTEYILRGFLGGWHVMTLLPSRPRRAHW